MSDPRVGFNPYQPPSSDASDFVPIADGAGPAKPVQGLATVLMVAFGLLVLLSVVQVWAMAGQLEVVDEIASGHVDLARAEAADERVRLSAMAWLLCMLLTASLWWTWAYRCSSNLRSFGAELLEYTPGSMIWWWFVPIFSLFRPYGGMRELAQASKAAASGRVNDWPQIQAPSLLLAWWIVYVIHSVVGGIAGRVLMGANELDTLVTWTRLNLGLEFVSILGAGLAIAVVRKITADQSLAIQRPAARFR